MSRPFRYTFILGLVALGAALAAVGGWRYARASAPVSGPIILLTIDALRADRLPVYGYTGLKTPGIDALAADGIVFERAYSHAPQTLPAHASLLSGRLPFETGVRDSVGFRVAAAERLLPEMLRDRGYETGGVVSSYELRRATGIAQGFDFFDDDLSQPSSLAPGHGLYRSGQESARIAENWLGSVAGDRVFLFLHLNEPHRPYEAPPQFAEYDPYDAEIAYVDEAVDRLTSFLKAHQLYDQSTIILAGDHGEGLGDHGEGSHGLLLYEEALRIPLIVKPAAGEGAGRRVVQLVQHIDVVPTILDLAKAPIPENVRGRSLTALLNGTGGLANRVAYAESMYGHYRFGWSELTSVTDGRYRLIKAADERLYDLAIDPANRRDVSAERPDEHARLSSALGRLTADDEEVDRPSSLPGEVSRVSALGHVGAIRTAAAVDVLPIDPAAKVAALETHRVAMEHAVAREWQPAIDLIRDLLRDDSGSPTLWLQLADFSMTAGRFDAAADAFRRASALMPGDSTAHLGAAAALLRLRRHEEAHHQAKLALEALALDATPEGNGTERAAAHELLARVEIARRNGVAARAHAALANAAEPSLPLPAYVEGRLLYQEERYGDALAAFETAVAALSADGPGIPDLHFYAGEVLLRLDRPADAEHHLLEELGRYPDNARARGSLALAQHTLGRPVEAGATLAELVRASPTREGYAIAERIWTTLGDRRQAERLQIESQRVLQPPRRAPLRAAQ